MSKKPTPEADKPKAEKPPKRGESPEEIAKLLSDIEKSEKLVQTAEIELDLCKDAAKTAKGAWLIAVGELRRLVRTRERWREEAKRQPLLQPKPDKLPEGAKEAKPIGILRDVKQDNGLVLAKKGETHTGYVDADGDIFLMIAGKRIDLEPEDWTEIVDAPNPINGEWRKFTIDRLAGDVTAKDREKLVGANLLTFGDLQDRMQRDGTWWARDIKGIGEAGQTRIEDAFNAAISEAATS